LILLEDQDFKEIFKIIILIMENFNLIDLELTKIVSVKDEDEFDFIDGEITKCNDKKFNLILENRDENEES
jgi:hypothetical protein